MMQTWAVLMLDGGVHHVGRTTQKLADRIGGAVPGRGELLAPGGRVAGVGLVEVALAAIAAAARRSRRRRAARAGGAVELAIAAAARRGRLSRRGGDGGGRGGAEASCSRLAGASPAST
jgi:hypothetical protein